MNSTEWLLYPPLSGAKILKPGNLVFIRTKSKKEIGRRGYIIDKGNQSNGKDEMVNEINEEERRITVKIAIKDKNKEQKTDDEENAFYTASFRPVRLIPVVETSFDKCTIMITKTTDKYRLLAASQLIPTDRVLEIGCSNGECSLVIAKYVTAGSLRGFDTSQQMVSEAKSKISGKKGYGNVQFHVIDPFKEPKKALILATESSTSENEDGDKNLDKPTPSVVFIDIGGNRDLGSVVKMLEWTMNVFTPRLCIIKSEEMVQSFMEDFKYAKAESSCDLGTPASKRRKSSLVHIEPNGIIQNGTDWFHAKLSFFRSESATSQAGPEPAQRFSHPKKAPLSLSPEDGKTPICRYYNYHKNGCQHANCPFDHKYCHWCQERGHIGRYCTNTQT